jgi:uncharacterized membrane protein YhaH (DUF805 family)
MKIITETCRLLAIAWLILFGTRYALLRTELFFRWHAPGREWLYRLPNLIGQIGTDWWSAWPLLVPVVVVVIVTVFESAVKARQRRGEGDGR